jgi:TRAP-type C4-dicarboxylate transport system substrate-binding protein
MDLWNKLPADLKTVLELEAYELAWRCYRNSQELDNVALQKMRAGGLKEFTLPAAEVEEVRKIARECWEEEAQKTEMGKEILDSQVAVMEEFGLLE